MGFPLQTYLQLQKDLGLEKELPITPDWSAAADFLELIKNHCLKAKPKIIVECSSGATTVVLAKCCQINKQGKVFSLENGEEYASNTQNNLKDLALENYAEVIYAPLEGIEVNNESYQWYETKNLPDQKIDMLVIDGPPGFIQRHSRLPALPLLFDQLADNAIVFLDDAARDDEREIVEMWLGIDSGIDSGISHEFIETERGCSVLTVNKN